MWLKFQTCETTCPHKKMMDQCGCYWAPFELYYGTKVVTNYTSCTSAEGTTFPDDVIMLSALLALCEGNPLVINGFPSQRVSNVEFWCFFDFGFDSRLKKMSRCRWFEAPCRSCDTPQGDKVGRLHVFKWILLYIQMRIYICEHFYIFFSCIVRPCSCMRDRY